MDQYIITYKVRKRYITKLVKNDKESIINEYKDKKFKLDRMFDEQSVNMEELKKIILDNASSGFPYGMIIKEHVILTEELFLNSIIDFENGTINYPQLNSFLEDKGKLNSRIELLKSVFIFQTESEYYDGEKLIPLIYKNGFHVIDRTSKDEILEAIKKSTNTLYKLLKPSGKFIYGISTTTDLPIDGYSIIRHCGALWSLCLNSNFIEDKNCKEKIEKSFDYLFNRCTIYKGHKAYLVPQDHGDYQLGGNAITLLAICEYTKQFKDNRYLEYAEKFARGILACQQPDGRFFHGYSRNLELTKQEIIVYYDGESVFALLKYYELCKNKIYLDAVCDAFDYFIEYGYESKYDHWIAHALRELVPFTQEDKYLSFLNLNCVPKSFRIFTPARLESIVSLYEAYSYLKKNKCKSPVFEEYPLNKVIEGIKFRLENLMCYYIGEEVHLYLKGEDVLYGFHDPRDNFRMRIDDIQHSCSGLLHYYLSDLDIKNID